MNKQSFISLAKKNFYQIKNINKFKLYVLISISSYLIFFYQLLLPEVFFWGSDVTSKFLPVRVYFHEKVTQNFEFPFWTERIFSGFPIFADPEHSYLHPINIISIILLGPALSYKVLHFAYYLLGSICFYLFLKKKSIGLLGASLANLIFYFNIFMLNHQIHFTIVMSIYLTPVAFYLLEKYIEDRRFIYVFLQSLVFVNSILWGHLQSSVILFIGIFLYLVIFGYKKIPFKSIILYSVLVPLLSTLFTLHQLLPSFELYRTSYRENEFDFRFGTFSTSLLLTSFVPYLLGTSQDESFVGGSIGQSVTYTEVYFYFGITTLIIFLFTLFIQKINKDLIFSYLSILIFLTFIFIGYIPLFFDNFPIISLFRYWVRFIIIPIFAISIIIAKYFDAIDFEFSKKSLSLGFTYIFSLILYIIFIFTLSTKDDKYLGLYNLFSPNYLLNTYKYFHEIILLSFLAVISIVISLLTKIKIINFSFRYHFIALIIFIDLYYFRSDVLQFRLGTFDNYLNLNPNVEFSGKRIIDLRSDLEGNEFLYLKSYSPFGYSQLREGFYVKEVAEAGLFRITGDEVGNLNKSRLEELGIETYLDESTNITISNNINFPFKNDDNVSFINKSESNYELEFNLENEEVVESYLKYNPNWIVLVNDQKIETINSDYKLAFKLPEGKNQVKITYFPQNFYAGLVLALVTLILAVTFIKLRPNKKI